MMTGHSSLIPEDRTNIPFLLLPVNIPVSSMLGSACNMNSVGADAPVADAVFSDYHACTVCVKPTTDCSRRLFLHSNEQCIGNWRICMHNTLPVLQEIRGIVEGA